MMCIFALFCDSNKFNHLFWLVEGENWGQTILSKKTFTVFFT